MFKFLILGLTFLISVNSIMIATNPNKSKYCFTKYLHYHDVINFSFVTSSESSEYVDVSLKYNIDDTVLFQSEKTEQEKYSTEVKQSGDYTLCFDTRSKNEYYISFEFYVQEEKGLTGNLAKDSSLHNMKKEVSEMSRMLEEIERNLRFILDRRSVHHTAIIGMTHSIRQLSYVKIFVISLISILQIVIIQKFFSNSTRGKGSFGGSFEMGGL